MKAPWIILLLLMTAANLALAYLFLYSGHFIPVREKEFEGYVLRNAATQTLEYGGDTREMLKALYYKSYLLSRSSRKEAFQDFGPCSKSENELAGSAKFTKSDDFYTDAKAHAVKNGQATP